MLLDQLQAGQAGHIRRIHGDGAIRRRLMEMGMVRGAAITMVKVAPLGDPVEYVLHGYHLTLRKSEARLVEVDLSPEPGSGI